ncbi:MAG: hypothetical protein JXQ75_18045 [Phycisphaerae bacterium]|nr:hypothetical protein [Phycisphaerae bacterium]
MIAFAPVAEMTMQQSVLLCGAIILATVLLMNMRRRRPLDGSPKQYRREIDSATAQSAGVKRDMEQLLIELEELSRKINAQIDTKFAKLERSIADADKRISAFRILIDEAKRVTDGIAPSAGPSPADASPDAPAVQRGEVESPREDGTSPRGDERRRRIYELADRGSTAVEIAQELDQTVGEVELILNLRDSVADNAGQS